MRPAPASGLAILALLAVAVAACGDREEAAAPEGLSAEGTPAAAQPPEPEGAAAAKLAAESAPAEEAAPAVPEPAAAAPSPAAGAAAAAGSAAQPATIDFEIYKAGFIVGVSGGKGTLHYQGASHPLTIAGVSLGATAGLSRAEMVGDVRNLHRLADIEGTYSATQAGVALGGGAKVTRLENARGVVLEVRGKQIGFELALDLNGMQISLAN
jgi:hypothetical protein